VKEVPGNVEVPAAVTFEQSKVVSNIDAGYVDTVEPQKAQLNTKIHVGGWAADLKKMTSAKAVIAVVDGKQAAVPIQMGMKREDVAKAYRNNNLVKAGWDGELTADALGKGKHRVEFFALVAEGKFVRLKYKDGSLSEITVTE
jgi:hypothetical protein